MKKKLLSVLLTAVMALTLVACGKTTSTSTPASTSKTSTSASKADDKKADEPDARGMLNGKFVEKRSITVECYDRNVEGGTEASNNAWTKWIQDQMLERYNVEVTFVPVSRWSETDDIGALLAAQNAPDVCYTYGYGQVQTYAAMDGIIDLKPLLDENKDLLTNMFDWLGESVIYQDLDPATGTLWAIEGKRNETARINTFVRKDWLDKLGIAVPTTKAEFEAMLIKFKENAETLLGADAARMVPFSISSDVGWRAANIIESFMDPDITDKELYVNGYDDRKFTENGTKEAIRLLNKWYNEGLIWKDFAIQASDSTAEDDMIKAGFVGAFIHNYDYPFRNDVNSINYTLASLVEGGKFIAVNCFEDKNGKYTKYSYSNTGDRKAFFPATNDEPIASLCYLEFMSDPAVVEYLQMGDEGVNHTVDAATGAWVFQQADEAHHDWYVNSGKNIDYTLNCNGLRLATPELTNLSLAYGYAEVDPADVKQAIEAAMLDARAPKAVSVGDIAAETEGVDLVTKRDTTFAKAITAAVADFDTVWDAGMAEYLQAGGQAIIDERKNAWEATYGSDTMLP